MRDETYVVYFYTAGTKPAQPAVRYCPHSAADLVAAAHTKAREAREARQAGSDGDEAGCEPRWPPSAPSNTAQSRGVRWSFEKGYATPYTRQGGGAARQVQKGRVAQAPLIESVLVAD